MHASAAAVVRAISRGDVTAAETVEAALRRIDALNPALCAVVTRCDARARAEAQAVDVRRAAGEALGPLAGVPITVKDGFATEGIRTTWGLPFYRGPLIHHVPAADAPTVATLRRAGAIVVGKTNLPLGSYDWQARHPWLGRARNPHDLARTPGGSSGGCAAAVAAGLVPISLGADIAGSLRVPAHFCGVWAFRPTEGRLSMAGGLPPGHPGLPHMIAPGPLARTAGDLRLALSVLDPSLPAAVPIALPGLRIGVSETLASAVVGVDIREALTAFVGALAGAGAGVSAAAPVWGDAERATWGTISGAEFARGAAPLGWPGLRCVGPLLFRAAFGRGPWPAAHGRGFAASDGDYQRALADRAALLERLDGAFDQMDVWAMPVAGITAFTHRRTGSDLTVDGRAVGYTEPLGDLNSLTALAGTPAVVVPVGRMAAGLPVGIQLHARRGADAFLLDVAAAIEAAGLSSVPPPPAPFGP